MNYTLIFQNIVSKDVYSYNVLDLDPSSIYYKFDIQLWNQPDGEYEYLLIENPERLEVVDTIIAKLNKGCNMSDIMMSTETPKVVAFGLCRVGDYKASNVTYNKDTKYTTYERK